mgnify:CR=1 FL=1
MLNEPSPSWKVPSPLILTAAQTPDVTKQDCRRTTFRTTTNLIHQQHANAQFVDQYVGEYDNLRLAGVNPDYVYGTQSWAEFQNEFETLRDFEMVSEQFPAFLSGEYESEIQAILDADPDIVHSALYSGDMISFIRQAIEFDFFEQIDYFLAGVVPMHVTTALGDEMPDNVLAVADSYYQWPEDNERRAEFVETYRNEHDGIPSVFSFQGSSAFTALKEAIEAEGGTTTDDIVAGLEGLEYSSVTVDKEIRAGDHQAVHDFYLAGALGPLEDEDFYGFTELEPVPRESWEDDVECQL